MFYKGCFDRGSIEHVQAYAIKMCLFDDNLDVIMWNKMMSQK